MRRLFEWLVFESDHNDFIYRRLTHLFHKNSLPRLSDENRLFQHSRTRWPNNGIWMELSEQGEVDYNIGTA